MDVQPLIVISKNWQCTVIR